MEKNVKVEMKNAEGKIILKEVPETLLSLYLNIGWKKSTNGEFKFQPKKTINIDENIRS